MGLYLAEHDVDVLFGQFLFLLCQFPFLLPERHFMLKLDVDQDKEQGKGHADIDNGDPSCKHLRRAAAQRHEDVQQEEQNLPPFQLSVIEDHQCSKQKIAEQRHKLGDEKQRAALVSVPGHIEKRTGKRAEDGKEDLHRTYRHNGQAADLFCPALQPQIGGDVAGEKVQHKGRSHIEKRAPRQQEASLPPPVRVMEHPVGKVAGNHKDVGKGNA